MPGSDSPFLSIIVPAYNEASRIESTLEQIEAYLHSRPFSAELVVVDDGSFDDTARRVEEMARQNGRIRLLRTPHRGKGHAVKSGMAAARGGRRFFCDADLSMPIAELDRFLEPALSQFDLVIGSR
ncbi:MAG: glycosyltransferase, partial [Chloroflexi bacterium]|nr:glycosyltransferase [Chloroflexota bacterium]